MTRCQWCGEHDGRKLVTATSPLIGRYTRCAHSWECLQRRGYQRRQQAARVAKALAKRN